MKNTDKKAVALEDGTIYANNKVWTEEQLAGFRKYQTAYIKEKYRTFVLRFSKTKDSELIEYLESQEELTSYIKNLVSKDMKSAKRKKCKEDKEKLSQ